MKAAKEEKNWENTGKSHKDHRLGNAPPSPKEKAKPKPKAKSEAKDAQDSAPVLPDKKKPKEKAKLRGGHPTDPENSLVERRCTMPVSFLSREMHEGPRVQVQPAEKYGRRSSSKVPNAVTHQPGNAPTRTACTRSGRRALARKGRTASSSVRRTQHRQRRIPTPKAKRGPTRKKKGGEGSAGNCYGFTLGRFRERSGVEV